MYGYVCETLSSRTALAFTLSISAPNGLRGHELQARIELAPPVYETGLRRLLLEQGLGGWSRTIYLAAPNRACIQVHLTQVKLLTGIEPVSCPYQGRALPLSYRSVMHLEGLEPPTFSL